MFAQSGSHCRRTAARPCKSAKAAAREKDPRPLFRAMAAVRKDGSMNPGAVWRAGFACAVACAAFAASIEAGQPFLVRAEFPLAECSDLLDDLGEIQKQLATTLRLPSAREPVHIVLFRDE